MLQLLILISPAEKGPSQEFKAFLFDLRRLL